MGYDLQPAIETLKRSLQNDPECGSYSYALAALLALDGDLEGAWEYLKIAESRGVDGKVLREWMRTNWRKSLSDDTLCETNTQAGKSKRENHS